MIPKQADSPLLATHAKGFVKEALTSKNRMKALNNSLFKSKNLAVSDPASTNRSPSQPISSLP